MPDPPPPGRSCPGPENLQRENPAVARTLTLIIPCKNEAAHIAACIASARAIADEILVADSGSTDDTREIARRLGARIIEREYVHSGDFKNWAIPQASHEWVLLLDADERLTAPLRQEIRTVLEKGPVYDGYWIRRSTTFLGRPLRYGGCHTDRVIRLFHRDRARYVGHTDHAEIGLPRHRVGTLQHRMLHHSYRSLDDYFRKFHRYTRQKAEVKYARGQRASLIKMLFTVPFRFLHLYFIRRGFLDGYAGLVFCMLSAMASFVYQAHMWEIDVDEQRRHERATDPASPNKRAA